jgi:hypothetical protein
MITSMSPITWCYIRFSNKARQSDGDSERRQEEAMLVWCERNGYATDPQRILRDRGRSGYKGANLGPKSAFGGFLKAVQEGRVPRFAVLAIEQIDRLTRLPRKQAERVIDLLLDHDIRIACIDTGEIFDARSNDNLLSRIGLMLRVDLAHRESEAKSRRNSGVWVAGAREAREGTDRPTTRCPSWMDPDPDGGKPTLNRHAQTVADIFALCIKGLGMDKIAACLNKRRVETLPQDGVRQRSLAWNSATVRRVLTSIAAYGAWQPHEVSTVVKETKVESLALHGQQIVQFVSREVRTPRGDAVEDYYPAAVTRAVFDDARRAREARERTGGRGGGTRNPLAGRIVCSQCGTNVQRTIDYRSYKHESFYCPGRRVGKCDSGYVPAEKLTIDLLDRIRLGFGVVAGRREPARDALYDEIRSLEDTKAALDRELVEWRKSTMGKPKTAAILDEMEFLKGQIAETENNIAEQRRRLTTLDLKTPEVPPHYDALVSDYASGAGPKRDLAARLLAQAVREVVQQIRLSLRGEDRGGWVMTTVNGWAVTSSDGPGWAYLVPDAATEAEIVRRHPSARGRTVQVTRNSSPKEGLEIVERMLTRTDAAELVPSMTRAEARERALVARIRRRKGQ